MLYQIQQLTKQYRKTRVLDIEQLEIPSGQCFGLVGNNGAGKTTLFRLMLDMIQPSAGTVLFEGQDVKAAEDWKHHVGAYLDEHMLLSYLTPDEYFETLRKIYGLSQTDVNQHMERFRILFNDEIIGKKKYIRDLSKGNIKKVGIAAALLNRPRAVLLDEPFENLDPSSQTRLKQLIREYREEGGTTFLISSHDLNHITEIADRIVVLEKGLLIRDITEKETMSSELDSYFNKV